MINDDVVSKPSPWTAWMEAAAEFVKRFGRPYEPGKDDYQDPRSFARPVGEGKNGPIYNAHAYHTKVPPESIVRYLKYYTRRGDLVLDPFCGRGMTGVASLMIGRHATVGDLSTAPTHIGCKHCYLIGTGNWLSFGNSNREFF